jgi:hypothetical protein
MSGASIRLLGLFMVLEAVACVGPTNDEDTETGCLPGSADCPAETSTGDGDGDGDGDTQGDGDGDGDGDGETTCHPLMISCPTVGQTCTWDGSEFRCVPSITKLGDSCVPDMPQCVSGFCAPMAEVPGCPSTHCCAAFCNLDSPFCPIEGTTCVEYFPAGATTPNVGACVI